MASKTHREFHPKAFYRKLGQPCLLSFVRHQKHPLLSEIEFLMADEETDYSAKIDGLHRLLESDDNPNKDHDLKEMALMNDLASEKGMAQMRLACEVSSLEALLEQHPTPHQLACELLQSYRHVFDFAYTMLQVDYVEGWRLYAGRKTSPLKTDKETAKTDFENHLRDALRASGLGPHISVEVYTTDQRLILDIRYAGPLVRHEDFGSNGQLTVSTIRKPMDIGLVYYLQSGVLKVKTPRGYDTLSDRVHQGFAFSYLDNPEALIELRKGQVINLDELKTRSEFPTNAEDEIRSVRLKQARFKPYVGSKDVFSINAHQQNVWTFLQNWNLDIDQIELLGAGLQFEFEGKGRSRFRTVELNQKTVKLNNSPRDEVITKCLKNWGILYV